MSDTQTTETTNAWRAGADAMRRAIAHWHADQSRWFAADRPNMHMTDDDRAKFLWAAASHAAHSAHISRMPLPEPPDAC